MKRDELKAILAQLYGPLSCNHDRLRDEMMVSMGKPAADIAQTIGIQQRREFMTKHMTKIAVAAALILAVGVGSAFYLFNGQDPDAKPADSDGNLAQKLVLKEGLTRKEPAVKTDLLSWVPKLSGDGSVAKAPLICKLRVTRVISAPNAFPSFEAEVLRVFKGHDTVAQGQQVILVSGNPPAAPGVDRLDELGPTVRSFLDSDRVWLKDDGEASVYLMALAPADPPTDDTGRPVLTGAFQRRSLHGTRVPAENAGAPTPDLASDTLFCLRQELLAAMGHDSMNVRRSAITALRNWHGERHGNDQPPAGDLWTEATVRPVVLQATRDPDWKVRWTAAWIIANGQPDDLGNETLAGLLFDPDGLVRQPARRALGKRGFAELAGPAQDVVDYELEENLGGCHLKMWTDMYGEGKKGLISGLKHRQWQVRVGAAWSAGVLRRRDVVEQLTEILQDEHFKVRRGAAWSLGQLGGEGVPEALTEALADDEGRVRVMAAWALAKLGDEHGFESLADLLANPDARTAAQAAEMLGRLDGQQAVGLLLVALEDERPAVRGFGVMALRPFLNGKHVAVIRKALDSMANDKSAFVRAAVDAVDFDR